MRKKKILLILSLSISTLCFGQGFSLRQCIDFATSNNENKKMAGYDLAVAQKKVDEQLGTMLPQIDGSGSYTDNLKLSKTVLPGDLLGKPGQNITFSMGTQYNASVGLQLTQKIFDPTFSVALKAAKVNKQYYQQSLQKMLEQTAYNVSSAYYQCLINAKQCETLKATLTSSKKLLSTNELQYKNGMVKKIDVDKIRVSLNSTSSQLDQSELNYKQSLNTLKYQMGMPVEKQIVLTDSTATDIDINEANLVINDKLNVDDLIDYQLQKTNMDVQELQKRQTIRSYLPTLNFSANYNYNAMGSEFNFMGKTWYNTYSIGLTLKVPIFDGFQKKSKIAQSKFTILKAQENIRLTEQSIKVDVSNYEIQYKDAIDNIHNEKDNLDLAQSVYNTTQLQYKQGVSSALDLVQAESSLRESQNNYFNKLFSLFIARLDLEKSKGTLMNYINNFK